MYQYIHLGEDFIDDESSRRSTLKGTIFKAFLLILQLPYDTDCADVELNKVQATNLTDGWIQWALTNKRGIYEELCKACLELISVIVSIHDKMTYSPPVREETVVKDDQMDSSHELDSTADQETLDEIYKPTVCKIEALCSFFMDIPTNELPKDEEPEPWSLTSEDFRPMTEEEKANFDLEKRMRDIWFLDWASNRREDDKLVLTQAEAAQTPLIAGKETGDDEFDDVDHLPGGDKEQGDDEDINGNAEAAEGIVDENFDTGDICVADLIDKIRRGPYAKAFRPYHYSYSTPFAGRARNLFSGKQGLPRNNANVDNNEKEFDIDDEGDDGDSGDEAFGEYDYESEDDDRPRFNYQAHFDAQFDDYDTDTGDEEN